MGGLSAKQVILCIIVAAVFVFGAQATSGGKGKSGNSNRSYNSNTGVTSYKCQSCGRTFTDSDNKNSIRSTNMCKNCYNNYKIQKDAGY